MDVKAMQAKIGQLALENDFLEGALIEAGMLSGKAMIDPKHAVSITRQAELLGISRAAVYYVPRPICEEDLALQRRIDELHLECPFAGARTLRDLLKQEGIEAAEEGDLCSRVIGRDQQRNCYRGLPEFPQGTRCAGAPDPARWNDNFTEGRK